MHRYLPLAALVALLNVSLSNAEDTVFSGPQAGEKLPAFEMKGVFGDQEGKVLDLVEQADDKPVLLIFLHQRTRPAFGLLNTLTRFAASRGKDGLTSGVCFLTDDATATGTWLRQIQRHLTRGVVHGISPDGLEGPGNYGLNRNVALTVLVANKGRVTANFALVQPSVQADGPKIFRAIIDALGGGDVPEVARFAGPQYAGRGEPMRPDAAVEQQMRPLLRPLIDKTATLEQVDEAAKGIERFLAENKAAQKEIGRICRTIVGSGKLENYGTKKAQEYLRVWARKYGSDRPQAKPERPRVKE